MTHALFVHSGNMYGGVERVLETIARSRQQDLDCRFGICFDGQAASRLRMFGAALEMLGPVRLTRPDLLLRARARLASMLRRERTDVFVTQGVWSHVAFAPVARRAHIPIVLWVHDELTGKPWLERLATRVQPDLMICNSRYTLGAARTLFPSVPATVIRCPLVFDEAVTPRHHVREQYGVSNDAVVIASVARMEAYKGQRVLIDALKRIERDEAWTCWIVGGAQRPSEVPYERSLRDAVATMGLEGRVRFLGQQGDIRSLLGAADLFCHPVQGAEPFGLAIVEALGAGLPVVASGAGGPEEILADGHGRLVPSGDVVLLADALESLIADPAARKQLAESGPTRALALCDANARLAQLAEELARLQSCAAA